MSMLLTDPANDTLDFADERGYIERLMRRIVAQCPRRKSASADERRAQQIHELLSEAARVLENDALRSAYARNLLD